MTQLPRQSAAVISACGTYRYTLERQWDAARPLVLFVMLNPSTADAELDDPTIRRCTGFARSWGYGGLLVGNLFAFRVTDPRELWQRVSFEAIGAHNDLWLARLTARADYVVAAWGAQARAAGRARQVTQLLDVPMHALALTQTGEPRHPLYVRGDARPVVYFEGSPV
jgi:hypothetical protein